MTVRIICISTVLVFLLSSCQKENDISTQNEEVIISTINSDNSSTKKPYKHLQSELVNGIYYIPSYNSYLNPVIEQSTSENAIFYTNKDKTIQYCISQFDSSNIAVTIHKTSVYFIEDDTSLLVPENTSIYIINVTPYYYKDDFYIPCKINKNDKTGYVLMRDIYFEVLKNDDYTIGCIPRNVSVKNHEANSYWTHKEDSIWFNKLSDKLTINILYDCLLIIYNNKKFIISGGEFSKDSTDNENNYLIPFGLRNVEIADRNNDEIDEIEVKYVSFRYLHWCENFKGPYISYISLVDNDLVPVFSYTPNYEDEYGSIDSHVFLSDEDNDSKMDLLTVVKIDKTIESIGFNSTVTKEEYIYNGYQYENGYKANIFPRTKFPHNLSISKESESVFVEPNINSKLIKNYRISDVTTITDIILIPGANLSESKLWFRDEATQGWLFKKID